MLKDPDFNEFQKITNGLFIGNQISVMNNTKLAEAGITQVLKVNGIPSNFPYKNCTEKVIAFEDSASFTLGDAEMRECFAFID